MKILCIYKAMHIPRAVFLLRNDIRRPLANTETQYKQEVKTDVNLYTPWLNAKSCSKMQTEAHDKDWETY